MKLMPVDLPDSYLKQVEESSICVGIYIPERLRIEIRENLRQELGLYVGFVNRVEYERIPGFFDNCINCGRILHNRARKSHLFHKEIEVFVVRFCCACYKQFKDKRYEDFPTHLIDNILKNREDYKAQTFKTRKQ